jgi:carbon-monoxide dehydrogenase small subunit
VMRIETVVNGDRRELEIRDHELLIDVIRERLQLTGTKLSCDLQVCGACTVLLDGVVVSACTTLAAELDGRELVTVEGLADGGRLHPVQRAFVEHGATQCGFCTSGMVMSVCGLVSDHPDAEETTAREYLAGTICRCTGYVKIMEAVQQVVDETRGLVANP